MTPEPLLPMARVSDQRVTDLEREVADLKKRVEWLERRTAPRQRMRLDQYDDGGDIT